MLIIMKQRGKIYDCRPIRLIKVIFRERFGSLERLENRMDM